MHPFSRRRATLADFAKAVVLALAYLWLARLGLRMHAISSFATLIWPPTGLALASMLLWGFRFFPAITLAAFVANLWTGAPPLVALGIAAGNTLEAVAGAYALRRIPGFRCSLDRLKDVVGLIALAAVGASTISATIGVASLAAGGLVRPELLGTTWFAWWLGDAIAAMIVAPLLLTLRVDRGAPVRPSRVPEAAAVTLLLAAASLYLFEFTTGGVAVTLSPLLVWAAVRFEQKGAACSVFLVSVVAIWATARGHGPFARESVEASLFTVQTFLALTTATFLVLGATTAERRRAEEELRRAKNEAEAANRAKDQFLATLSHELRTPLTPVLAFASSLEKRTELSPDVRRQVQIVRRNAELEARLIDDMLDLTRIAKGKLQIEPEPVFVRDAVEHVLEICRDDAAAKGVVLEREEETGEALVHADPARLRQVIWNLVKNSIKFTPPGGRIRVRLFSPTAASIAIEVTDTGAGFDESNASRLFQPFEQAGERTDGLGLGLAISKSLVEAHGGSLTATSAGRGRGASFRVELPVLARAEPAAAQPGAHGATRGEPVRRRILLVEDHVDTAAAARELLSDLSCDVLAVGTVEDALAAAGAQRFDLVLSDLGLPDGSGIDLMRRLRDQYGLFGIAVTGYGMEDDVRRSGEAGFVDHLVKPITFQRLANAIERFFAKASA